MKINRSICWVRCHEHLNLELILLINFCEISLLMSSNWNSTVPLPSSLNYLGIICARSKICICFLFYFTNSFYICPRTTTVDAIKPIRVTRWYWLGFQQNIVPHPSCTLHEPKPKPAHIWMTETTQTKLYQKDWWVHYFISNPSPKSYKIWHDARGHTCATRPTLLL